MGVMSCSRNSCEKIMCDTYVNNVGYVCNECQEEFKLYLQKNGTSVETEGQIERELDNFMKTEKNSYKEGKEVSVDVFFKDRTRN